MNESTVVASFLSALVAFVIGKSKPPKVEYKEIIKEVPRTEFIYEEVIKEVPRTEFVYEEVIKEVPKVEYVEKEVIKYVEVEVEKKKDVLPPFSRPIDARNAGNETEDLVLDYLNLNLPNAEYVLADKALGYFKYAKAVDLIDQSGVYRDVQVKAATKGSWSQWTKTKNVTPDSLKSIQETAPTARLVLVEPASDRSRTHRAISISLDSAWKDLHDSGVKRSGLSIPRLLNKRSVVLCDRTCTRTASTKPELIQHYKK